MGKRNPTQGNIGKFMDIFVDVTARDNWMTYNFRTAVCKDLYHFTVNKDLKRSFFNEYVASKFFVSKHN